MSAVNDVETRVGHEGHKIVEFHPSVFVKVSKRTTMSRSFHPKIDNEKPAARAQNSANLADALFARRASEVMKHHGGEDHVELRVGKRERFSPCRLEYDLDLC